MTATNGRAYGLVLSITAGRSLLIRAIPYCWPKLEKSDNEQF
ncbi:hypothetical protein [Epilithonimonas hungarica]|nr:hypothetical protein [Epilithonimonas hungarica]